MRTKKIVFMVVLACFALLQTTAFCEEGTERRPPKEKWTHEIIQATVESIDLEKREAVLRDKDGTLSTVKADDSVKRFHELKAGDEVTAEYWMFIQFDFRDPTPAEKQRPLVVLAEAGKAPRDEDPAAAAGAVIRAVVTVEVINRPKMKVTVKGPRGNFVTFPAEDKALIEELHVGEVAIITYSEALALSVEKVEQEKKD
jgi:hypothetical protein